MAPAHTPRSRFVVAVCVLTALYWMALFVATHVPTPRRPPNEPRRSIDKQAHVVAFAGLALLLCATGAAFKQPSWRTYLIVLGIIAAYGVIDEVTQAFVPTRSADWQDWAADMAGAVCGLVTFAAISKLFAAGAPGPSVAQS
jgi:VanZ family protein